MRLFLDASISPALAEALKLHGFDVIAQRDVLHTSSRDEEVLGRSLEGSTRCSRA
jgi:predicted nuclease of predicted toxin-antitoxin system